MRFGSMCSGIEAASMAWQPLDWEADFFAEIEAFPSAILKFHYPHVPNYGDMTKFESWPDHAIDLLIAGTPCQSFSVAGLRKGLDDPRGNLMLVFGAVAQRYRPRWVAWENVPGVLSDDGGRSFASLLGLLSGRRVEVPRNGWGNAGVIPGYKGAYGLAWRVLDAQYVRVDGFGRAVPQRRRRVFVVGYLGDWRPAAAVLLEPEGMRGDSPPSRRSQEDVAGTFKACTASGGWSNSVDHAAAGYMIPVVDEVSRCDTAGYAQRLDFETENFVAHVASTLPSGGNSSGGDRQPGTSAETAGTMLVAQTLRAEGFDASEDGTGRQNLIPVSYAIQERAISENIKAGPQGKGFQPDLAYTLEARHHVQAVATQWAVRRLTPRECERLQGFPDDFTNIPWRKRNGSPDGPRYKALGNSMAVNVMRWLGQRIDKVDKLA